MAENTDAEEKEKVDAALSACGRGLGEATRAFSWVLGLGLVYMCHGMVFFA